VRGREDATERLLDVASIEEDEWPGPVTRLKDWLTWRIIYAGNGARLHSSCQHAAEARVSFELALYMTSQ
jgi:hypothetical protein